MKDINMAKNKTLNLFLFTSSFLFVFCIQSQTVEAAKKVIAPYKTSSDKLTAELEVIHNKWEQELLKLIRGAKKTTLKNEELFELLKLVAEFAPHINNNSVGEELGELKTKYAKNYDIALERLDSVSAVFLKQLLENSEAADD